MSYAVIIPLLISCQFAAANNAVLDIFSSDADCNALGPVQASIRREVGICWNLPPDLLESFMHSKKSYRIESCENTSPFLSSSVSVYDARDCEGLATTVNMNNIIPATCMGSMRLSCQEAPVSLVEEWPAIEMWLPTTHAVKPECSPALHPPIVMSYRPDCALLKKYSMTIRADCSMDDMMALHFYKDVNSCPTSDVPPFWSIEANVDTCQLAGDVFENWPTEDPVTMCGCIPDLVGMTEEQRTYWVDLVARTSIKFRCF